jgi:hypothetical protein
LPLDFADGVQLGIKVGVPSGIAGGFKPGLKEGLLLGIVEDRKLSLKMACCWALLMVSNLA